MRFSIATLVTCAGAAQAFSDTSPFLMFSNSPLPKELSSISTAQLRSSSAVLETTKAFMKDCPSDLYYIISQISLSSIDLASSDAMPNLRKALHNPAVQSRYSVSEMVGSKDFGVASFTDEITRNDQCGSYKFFEGENNGEEWREALRKGNKVVVVKEFPFLSAGEDERREELADNDAKLHEDLFDLAGGYRYTVIFTSSPPLSPIQPSSSYPAEEPLYESEFQNLDHIDLKRNLRIREDNSTTNATDLRPLFEKYQFLTPGLFMGLLVSIILLAILGVGLSAISSLEVSYGAFDKEMGPSAQKKQ